MDPPSSPVSGQTPAMRDFPHISKPLPSKSCVCATAILPCLLDWPPNSLIPYTCLQHITNGLNRSPPSSSVTCCQCQKPSVHHFSLCLFLELLPIPSSSILPVRKRFISLEHPNNDTFFFFFLHISCLCTDFGKHGYF